MPSIPLFLPVTRQRDATRLPSSFWNVSMTSNLKSATCSKNSFTHSLNLSFETISMPPVVMMKSSTTNLSIASGLRAFQTAGQQSSTILSEFSLFILTHVSQRVACHRLHEKTRATHVPQQMNVLDR